jgi:hypothetical protein
LTQASRRLIAIPRASFRFTERKLLIEPKSVHMHPTDTGDAE